MNINKGRSYSIGKYTFVNYTTFDSSQLKTVWEWINHPSIRANMYNTGLTPWESHVSFVERLRDDDKNFYWLVYKKQKPIGIFNINDVSFDDRSCDPGLTLSPDMLGSGLGLDFIFHCFLFCFETLGFNQLHSAVKEDNENAIKMDEYVGCVFSSSFLLNDSVYKRFTITKQEFLSSRYSSIKIKNR